MTPIEALRLCAEALGDGFLKPEGREGYHRSCTACGGDLHGEGHTKDCAIGAAVAAAEAALAAEDARETKRQLWQGALLGAPHREWGALIAGLLCIDEKSISHAQCVGFDRHRACTSHHLKALVTLPSEDLQQVGKNAQELMSQGRIRSFGSSALSWRSNYEIYFTYVEPNPH